MKSVRRIGTALAALALIGTPAATTAPAATASPPSATPSRAGAVAMVHTATSLKCEPRLAILHRSTGTLFEMVPQPGVAAPRRVSAPAVIPLPIPATALASLREEPGMLSVHQDLSIAVNDGWYLLNRIIAPEQDRVTDWSIRRPGVRGWARMTALVEAPHWSSSTPMWSLYALDRTGAVYRYPQNPETDALGRRVLLRTPLLASLTLHSASEERDILLGTTRSGALVAIVVRGATRSSVGWVALRNRGWQSLDRLVIADCSRLVAIDSARNRAALYDVGYLRGGRTTIRSVGWSTGPWRNWVVAPYLSYRNLAVPR